ncbi:hypothetical protein J007_02276 [Cryptococcus neoformans]|nr:hypothetical protein C356_02291 [Cryptococcus neoformans var. grubii c45]OXB37923.1 hypothetical protein J007_02276 [Cryptococcus neoformans var. grubii]OXC62227.1 hypothetical protein C358_02346 [Cryptococcus neoformans var. grubii MW-RSA852]
MPRSVICFVPFLIAVFLTLAISLVDATQEQCVMACTNWSLVIEHCRWTYVNRFLNNQHDYTYNNQFVGCLCKGETATGSMGNNTISSSVGLCLNCHTTPGLVKRDLKNLLQLCAVQAQNGTAADAMHYRPQGYHTNITEPQPYEYQY